jgi:hypothetical protein
MPLIKTTQADSHGSFDFGVLQPEHYTLVVDDDDWGRSDGFDFEITPLPQETVSVTVDISPIASILGLSPSTVAR